LKSLEDMVLKEKNGKALLKIVKENENNPSSRYFGLAPKLWELAYKGLKEGTVPT